MARRNQVVRHRTRVKNEVHAMVHAILHAHLIPPCPHADLFGRLGRAWLERQDLPADEGGLSGIPCSAGRLNDTVRPERW